MGCPKNITPDARFVLSKTQLAQFGPGEAAPMKSSYAGQDRGGQPEQ